jgi:hypothetical protein
MLFDVRRKLSGLGIESAAWHGMQCNVQISASRVGASGLNPNQNVFHPGPQTGQDDIMQIFEPRPVGFILIRHVFQQFLNEIQGANSLSA